LESFETNKLFYNEYLYKINFDNQLASIFRNKNLRYAKIKLDELQAKLDSQETLSMRAHLRISVIKKAEFIVAKKLYDLLVDSHRYTSSCILRVEHPGLDIYTNDRPFIDKLASIVSNDCKVWSPKSSLVKHLLNNENIILVNKSPEYRFKVTLKDQPPIGALADWIENNSDKAKAGKIFLKTARLTGWVEGMYIYARDEKILQLISLMGVKIRRVDKLVCKQDLDK